MQRVQLSRDYLPFYTISERCSAPSSNLHVGQVARRRTTCRAPLRCCRRARLPSIDSPDRWLLRACIQIYALMRSCAQVLVLLAGYARGRYARLQRDWSAACAGLAECAEAAEVRVVIPLH
jgi:hypothetical protein